MRPPYAEWSEEAKERHRLSVLESFHRRTWQAVARGERPAPVERLCSRCGERGHYAKRCDEP